MGIKVEEVNQRLEKLTKNLINFNGKQRPKKNLIYLPKLLEFNKKNRNIIPKNYGNNN